MFFQVCKCTWHLNPERHYHPQPDENLKSHPVFCCCTLMVLANMKYLMEFVLYFRDDKRWSTAPGGAWLPHAMSSRMPHSPVWYNAGMLAQGSHEATNFRDPAVETRGLLYHGRFRVQRGISLLRPRPPPGVAAFNATVTPSPSSSPHVKRIAWPVTCRLLPLVLSCWSQLLAGVCCHAFARMRLEIWTLKLGCSLLAPGKFVFCVSST